MYSVEFDLLVSTLYSSSQGILKETITWTILIGTCVGIIMTKIIIEIYYRLLGNI